MSVLHIKTEVECRVFLFDEEKGIASSSNWFNIEVRLGEQDFLFVSTNLEALIFRAAIDIDKLDRDYRLVIRKDSFSLDMNKLIMLAEQGNPIAQNRLGACYYIGENIEKNWVKAVEWYRKAAEQGDSIAQYRLGNMYFYGKELEQDYKEAVKWLSRAAVQGVVYAQNNLGVCYDYGEGVEKNYEIAEKWYTKAAEQGCNKAQYNLGLLYRYHHGVERHNMGEEEFKWFRMAAESGLPEAQCRFGELFENGLAEIGLERDYIEAVKWYRKAAEQGYAIAQSKLSHMYEFGHGVDKNWSEALMWICKAAMQGYTDAMFKINFTFKELLEEQVYKEIKERYDNSPKQSLDIPYRLICNMHYHIEL